MGRRVRAVLLLAALLWGTGPAGALELQQGRIRLVLHERIGRFSLYLLGTGEGQKDLPLLVDQDPRTSFVSLFVENKIYRLGDNPEFKGRVEKTAEGAAFAWESGRVRVTMSFVPVSSRPDGEQDAVEIRLKAANLTQSTLSIGVRLLLDTALGEDGPSHFITSREPEIRREMSFAGSPPLRWWASAAVQKTETVGTETVGVECLNAGGAITPPNRVVFANWKRLSDAAWLYEPSASRNFSHVPYSINDSAVAQYYDPQPVAGGGEREIVLVMGVYDPAGYAAYSTDRQKLETILEEVSATADSKADDLRASVGLRLKAVEDLIREIDARLEAAAAGSGPETGAEDLRAMEQILQELNRKVEELPRSP